VLDAQAARAWLETPTEQQTRALLQAWTRIEAALKVTGVGIKGGTRGAVPRLASAGGAVRDLDIAPLIGAVAGEGTDWSVRGPEWWPGDQ
jgi:phosphopantetheinyl transferase